MPRELFLEGELLCQRPVREMYGLLGRELNVTYENESWRASLPERTFFMKLQVAGENQNLQIEFHQGEAGLEYLQNEKKLIFFRKNWVDHSLESRTESVEGLREIEIWSDHSSMEIFVNGGKTVFSARMFPQSGQPEITVKGNLSEEKMQICNIMKPEKKEEP